MASPNNPPSSHVSLRQERDATATKRVAFLEKCIGNAETYGAIVASGRFFKLTNALCTAHERLEAAQQSKHK